MRPLALLVLGLVVAAFFVSPLGWLLVAAPTAWLRRSSAWFLAAAVTGLAGLGLAVGLASVPPGADLGPWGWVVVLLALLLVLVVVLVACAGVRAALPRTVLGRAAGVVRWGLVGSLGCYVALAACGLLWWSSWRGAAPGSAADLLAPVLATWTFLSGAATLVLAVVGALVLLLAAHRRPPAARPAPLPAPGNRRWCGATTTRTR